MARPLPPVHVLGELVQHECELARIESLHLSRRDGSTILRIRYTTGQNVGELVTVNEADVVLAAARRSGAAA